MSVGLPNKNFAMMLAEGVADAIERHPKISFAVRSLTEDEFAALLHDMSAQFIADYALANEIPQGEPMTKIPKRVGDRTQPGLWWWPVDDGGKQTAEVRCPNGHTTLLCDHQIATSGFVDPSVVCPFHGCVWHEQVVLEGWAETGVRT